MARNLHLGFALMSRAGVSVCGWMSRQLITVGPEDSLARARLLMRQSGVRRLPVVEGRRPVGIVTAGDIVRQCPSGGLMLPERGIEELLRHVRVGGVMSLHPVTVGPAASLLEAARLMRARRIGGLLVVERGELVGIITKGDVLDAAIALLEDRGPSTKAGGGSLATS